MSKGKKIILIIFIFSAVVLALFIYTSKVAFTDSKNCNACHFITPFYKKWETSTHKEVPCLKCHEYKALKAVAGQFMFLAGAYNPRPLTNVPDKNCLQSGCHDKRLVESKALFTKRGINFDHKPHFNEMKRGIKLHCRSCHSDIVQGEHLKVSMNVCYLCHFKGVSHDQAATGCPSCHSAPHQPIVIMGKTFSHDEALKAGFKCNTCHTEITEGEGTTEKDKCYFCHVDKSEKYDDTNLIHEKHVSEKQIDCLWCHSKITHGKIKMAAKIPMLK
ncbi:MAG: hypothetical protein A2X59_09355 [Nitrospirae bacterium GWC2_42_7]|nr:MAG: hypothetical protein A2X59_09355 [Nitrospirae bacterium GWC2_42_7]